MTKYIDLTGQQFGEYRLSRWLGGGSSGDVYLGHHGQDQSEVALKVFNVHLARPEDQEIFLNEARTRYLKHPHIVPLLNCGVGNYDLPFLVMPYAAHGSLDTQHPRGLRMPLADVLRYVTPIAEALQYAHDRHIVHGAIKTTNLLLDAEGTLWLTDFELMTIAHCLQSQDHQPVITSSLPSNPPFEPASDQYAIGLIVYEWLCGKPPFPAAENEQEQPHDNAFPSLCMFVPDLTVEVDQVVQQALASDPAQRFASVQEFARALQTASNPEQQPIATRVFHIRATTTDEIDPYTRPSTNENELLAEAISSPYAEPQRASDIEDNPFEATDASLYEPAMQEPSQEATIRVEQEEIFLPATSKQTYAPTQASEDRAEENEPVPAASTRWLMPSLAAMFPPGSNKKQSFFLITGALIVLMLLIGVLVRPFLGNGAQALAFPLGFQGNDTQIGARGTSVAGGKSGYELTPVSTITLTSNSNTSSQINSHTQSTATTTSHTSSNGHTTTNNHATATPQANTKPASQPTPPPTSAPQPTPTPTPKPIVASVDGQNPTTYTVNGQTCDQTLSNSHSQHVTLDGVGATIYFRFSVTCHAAWAKIVFDKALPSGKYGNAKIVRINDGKAYTCDTGGNQAVTAGQTSCYTGMVQDNASETASAYGSYLSTWSSQLGPY